MLRIVLSCLVWMLLISVLPRSTAQARNAPLTVQLLISEVWGNPTLDLPPGNQRPDLYAVLRLNGEEHRTPIVTVPRINAAIFPDWAFSTVREPDFLRRDHTMQADIRIFDADATADEKVLLAALEFNPVTCAVTMGEQAFAGRWRNGRSRCVVQIPRLTSAQGYVALQLIGDWGSEGD